MRLRALLIGLLALTVLAGSHATARTAGGAEIRVGNLILRADGGFTPQALPKRQRVPIRFKGWAKIRTTDRTPPPAVRRVRLEFDRDGLVTTAGLPQCLPARLQSTTIAQARQRCRGAIVGSGTVAATLGLPSGRIKVSSPLTLFNGPRQNGNVTVVAHAQTTIPAFQSYVVVAPLERLRGYFGYRTKFEIPEIAGGVGALTDVRVRIGREYRHGGAQRSYLSARCSDSIFETYGLFRFADGNVFAGSVFKGCRQLP